MKKTILIIMGMLLISLATAYTIGKTITQEQFDSKDFQTSTLDLTGDKIWVENNKIYANGTMNSLKQNNESLWEIYNKPFEVFVALGYYEKCRNTNTKKVCETTVKEILKTKAKNLRQKERDWLDQQKTTEEIQKITNGDFIIDE